MKLLIIAISMNTKNGWIRLPNGSSWCQHRIGSYGASWIVDLSPKYWLNAFVLRGLGLVVELGLWAVIIRATGLGTQVQYIPRNMHTVFALLCFVVVIHWLIFPYPSGLLHWHRGNLTIAPVPAKQPWWIWINNNPADFVWWSPGAGAPWP